MDLYDSIYRSGKIFSNGSRLVAFSQLASSSSWCRIAHSMTIPKAREGIFSLYDGQVGNADNTFIFTVLGMKMRRIMVCKVHGDNNPKKAANLRHEAIEVCEL